MSMNANVVNKPQYTFHSFNVRLFGSNELAGLQFGKRGFISSTSKPNLWHKDFFRTTNIWERDFQQL